MRGGFYSSLNTALSWPGFKARSLRNGTWGRFSGSCHRCSVTAAAPSGIQLPLPSPLLPKLVWAAQLRLSAPRTLLCSLFWSFLFHFTSSKFVLQKEKRKKTTVVSVKPLLLNLSKMLLQHSQALCPVVFQINQDSRLLLFPLIWQMYQRAHFWHLPTSSSGTQKKTNFLWTSDIWKHLKAQKMTKKAGKVQERRQAPLHLWLTLFPPRIYV